MPKPEDHRLPQAEPSVPRTQIVRPPSPPLCPICLEVTSPQSTAKVLPCGHDYDIECIERHLRYLNSTPLCPLDRGKITAIRYDFTTDGKFAEYTFGKPAPITLLSGPFIKKEEEIKEDMTGEAKQRVMLLRRLNSLEGWDSGDFEFRHPAEYGLEDGKHIRLDWSLTVRASQAQTRTTSSVSRMVRLMVVGAGECPEIDELVSERIAKAKLEINKALERHCISQDGAKTTVQYPIYALRGDEKALVVNVERSVEVERYVPLWDNGRGEEGRWTRIITTTIMQEEFPPYPLPIRDRLPTDYHLKLVSNKRIVGLAREEIQGALDSFRGSWNDSPRWASMMRLFEHATTGIWEVRILVGECEVCGRNHQNAECWWDAIAEDTSE